jgi:thiol-disulfide isomerase/thioredoxin
MRSWWAKRRPLALAGLAVGVLAACSSSRGGTSVNAPNFELKDLSGNLVRLESFRGHPVLIDFWATWCGPCRISIPMVQEFYRRHKDEGVVVLGVNVDDDPTPVYPFVKEFGMTYPVLLAGSSNVSSDYEVGGLPHFVLVDPQGRIADRYEGFSMRMVSLWEDDLQRITHAKPLPD